MALFAVDRDNSSYADVPADVLNLRVQACAARFPNMRWIRSYSDEGDDTSVCIYEAESAADLEAHARLAGLSCLRVRRVTEWTPAPLPELEGGDRIRPGPRASAPGDAGRSTGGSLRPRP